MMIMMKKFGKYRKGKKTLENNSKIQIVLPTRIKKTITTTIPIEKIESTSNIRFALTKKKKKKKRNR